MRPTSGKGCLRAALLSAAVAIGTIAPVLNHGIAVAAAGNTKWAMVLCKFSDWPVVPPPPAGSGFDTARSYLQALLTESGKGTGGMFDYWHDVSYGQIDLTGSVVTDWYTLPYSFNQALIISGEAPTTAPSATILSGTGVDVGSHAYAVSFVNDYGEGKLGPVTPVTIDAGAQEVDLSAIPVSTNPSVTARKIYRTKASGTGVPGSPDNPFYLVATVPGNSTTTYNDLVPDAALGAVAPGHDSAKAQLACVDQAKRDISFPSYQGIAVFMSAPWATWGGRRQLTLPDLLNGGTTTQTYGFVSFDVNTWNVTALAHEMGHGYGLQHSYDTLGTLKLIKCDASSNPGEYCDRWDIMSALKVWSYKDPTYQIGGPGLNVFNLDTLGWMPPGRTYTFGGGDPPLYAQTITLAALNHPEADGYLEARIPLYPWSTANPDNLPNPPSYYTIEFRHNDGWDRGIPHSGIVIHEVAPVSDTSTFGDAALHNRSYLVDTQGTSPWVWLPGQSFHDSADNVSISVDSIDDAAKTATVTIALDHALVPTSSGDGSSVPCGSPGGPVCYSPDGPPAP